MTEQTLINLGFECNKETAESSGTDFDWHYYTLDIGDLCIISNASDEAEKEGWWVEIFDSHSVRIKGSGDLEELIKILRNNTND
jgi:hypothetical protein